ncbi:MAG: DNA polymerase III subunit epsilon [Bifidobacteriaceae bacterium]|jgi:DNA polymerase-3 subunit epsilon|nr:DNA polymerase III subunit epsilon [Bifidobacteriaceae bacterium]
MRELAGFDTETTGVSWQADRVVTAALVRRHADGGEETRTWLINPGIEIPERAAAIHGITTEMARERGAPPEVALEEVAAALAACLAAGVPVLAFNAPFDLRILDADLRRHELPTLAERLGRPVGPVIDPLLIDRAVARYRPGKRKLVDLMAVYGIPHSESLHDALEDVRQSIAVFDAIERRFAEIASLDAFALHAWQAPRHRAWAESFNEWLASKGRVPDADPAWP